MGKKINNKKKKDVVVTKEFEKRKKILIITIVVSVVCLLALVGTSYAAFMISDSSEKEEMYKVGDLGVTFSENTSSVITLTSQYPMTDEEGINKLESGEAYVFGITNEGDYNSNYTIQIQNQTTGIPTSSIKYAINSSKPKLLSETENNILDQGTLYPGETKEFWLYMWLDESATTSVANKTYSGKIVVNGQATRVPTYLDNSGANEPVVADGMIPVVYDYAHDTWMVADTDAGWYSYNNQIWANAVTVSDATYRNAEAGTPIPMDVINTMWVWIPRYKYQITSNIGSSSAVTSPPRMDVVFESGTQTTGNYTEIGEYGYYTHPAFRSGTSNYKTTTYDRGGWSKELTGIWVGKFETGGSSTTPLIKPDIQSLRSQTVSAQFTTALKFAGGSLNTSSGAVTFTTNGSNVYGLNTTSNTVDTHMMKNTEWGAVAYLTQSKYGHVIDLNGTYNMKPSELYVNNSGNSNGSGFYTGRSGGNVSGLTPINGTYTNQTSTTTYNTYGFYTYNDYLLTYNTNTKSTTRTIGKGSGASTTGTIYGVYDMNGGAWDLTMANMNQQKGLSNFSVFPTQKYYDKYLLNGTSQLISKANTIKGDAIYETNKWYSDSSDIFYSGNGWNVSGSVSYRTYGGLYTKDVTGGGATGTVSFRTVLIP